MLAEACGRAMLAEACGDKLAYDIEAWGDKHAQGAELMAAGLWQERMEDK